MNKPKNSDQKEQLLKLYSEFVQSEGREQRDVTSI